MPRLMNEKTNGLFIPLGLFVFSFVLRIVFISSNQISGDEPFTIFHSQQSLSELFELFEHENNPPLHFVLLHFWIKLFGTSLFSVRFLSVLFGALTVIPIYKIGKAFFHSNAGITTALIFIFANVHIQESHDARVYTLLVFLCTYSYYIFLKLLENPKKKVAIAWYIITCTLMLYAHYLSLIILFTQFLSMLLIKKYRKGAFKSILLAQVTSVILFIPFLRVFLIRLLSSSENESWVPKPNIESLYWVIRELFNEPVVAVASIAALAGFIIFLIKSKKIFKQENMIIILCWFFIPYFLLFTISFYQSYFFTKYLMFASIGFYFIVAIFWNSIEIKKIPKIILLGFPVILMAITIRPNSYNMRSPKDVVEIIKKHKTPSTLLIGCPKWSNLVFCYYYNQNYFKNYNEMESLLKEENIHFIYDDHNLDEFDLLIPSQIIILEAGCNLKQSNQPFFSSIESRFELIERIENHPYVISMYN